MFFYHNITVKHMTKLHRRSHTHARASAHTHIRTHHTFTQSHITLHQGFGCWYGRTVQCADIEYTAESTKVAILCGKCSNTAGLFKCYFVHFLSSVLFFSPFSVFAHPHKHTDVKKTNYVGQGTRSHEIPRHSHTLYPQLAGACIFSREVDPCAQTKCLSLQVPPQREKHPECSRRHQTT